MFEIENPDASFTRFDSLRPFKEQLKQSADELARPTRRSDEEEQSLQKLETQLLYIEKVEQTRSSRLSQEELERENRMLRESVIGLESAREGAADARRVAERLEATIASLQWRAARLRMLLVATTLGMLILLLIVLVLRRR